MNLKNTLTIIGIVLFLHYIYPYIHTNVFYSQIVDDKFIKEQFPIDAQSNISIQNEPLQIAINPKRIPFKFGNYTITPVATFQLQARVLSNTRYYLNLTNFLGGEMDAAIFPIDLALGWRAWDNPRIREQIDVSQSNRFYFWHMDRLVLPLKEVSNTSSNMHIIPSSRRLFNVIYMLKRGDLVTMRGYLVNVTGDARKVWNTSLSRNDTGAGACEIFLVEEIIKK